MTNLFSRLTNLPPTIKRLFIVIVFPIKKRINLKFLGDKIKTRARKRTFRGEMRRSREEARRVTLRKKDSRAQKRHFCCGRFLKRPAIIDPPFRIVSFHLRIKAIVFRRFPSCSPIFPTLVYYQPRAQATRRYNDTARRKQEERGGREERERKRE